MKRSTTIRRTALARFVVAPLRSFALAAVALLLAAPSLAQSAAGGMVIADFNHDGLPDVLLPSGANALTLSFGSVPYGTFNATAKLVNAPTGCAAIVPGSVITADFNGDGFTDVAITCTGGPSTTSAYTTYILLGVGDGTFIARPGFDSLAHLLAADFNHDGLADLVAFGSNGIASGSSIAFFAGKGDGTFNAPVTSAIATRYSTGAAIDLNQDGYPDLVLGNFLTQGAETVQVYGNNQNGTFGASQSTTFVPSTIVTVGTYPAASDQSVLTGNFYGTGLTDLAVVDNGSTPGVYLIKNTSSGTTFSFATPIKTPSGGLQNAVAASVTGTATDLILYNGSLLSVLANDGLGNFSNTYASLSVPSTTGIFAAIDANGDGHADLYTASSTSNGASLAVNLVSGAANASSQPLSLTAGTVPVAGVWTGNINFLGSSASGSQTVNALATTTSAVSSKNPAVVGDSVTVSATVAPLTSTTYIPTGTLTFTDGGAPLGTVQLTSSLSGSVTTSALTAGPHLIRVVYSGDSIFAPSIGTFTQQVGQITPTILWATPAGIPYGTALSASQLNASATNPAGGAVIPGTFTYTPSAGTVLNAGTQTLTVLFTPTDGTNYTTAMQSVSLVVSPVAPLVAWSPAVPTITYGTALGAQQLNAVATGVAGASVPGTFTYTPAFGTVLGAGPQTLSVLFTPASANYTVATRTAQLTVTKAAPAITWPTPADIAYGTALSATQLNATAAGVTGAALPGIFVYTPASGTVLTPGTQTLSVTFTPTDLVDYAVATATVKLNVSDLAFASFTPNTAQIGDPAKTITITGSGFLSTTIARVNGTSIATTFVNPTTLTAVVPAANFATPATLQITLSNPSTSSISAALPLTVSAPTPVVTFTAPPSTPPGSQPGINFTLSNAYPVPLVATFTLSVKSGVTSGAVDPTVQFAAGGTSFTATIAAGAVTIPPIQVQSGTDAATITVTSTLTANGIPVGTVTPVTINVPAAIPSITATTIARSGTQLTVTTIGFSNTREIVQANFHFTPIAGATLTQTDITAPVAPAFTTWFANPASLPFGSTFRYDQVFDISDDASKIGSVQVTLTNALGASAAQTAQ